MTVASPEQRTLMLIKPDAYARGLVGEIISRIERKGYRIVALRVTQATSSELKAHYADHVDKSFYPQMAEYMSSGPLVALVVEGHQVIAGTRAMMGATMPTEAAPGTIRGDYGRDWGTGDVLNLVHGSDSVTSAHREISIWFPELSD